MQKLTKFLVALVCAVLFTVLIGCAALQDYVTPCMIDERAAEYSDAEINVFLPYTTVADAKRIGIELNYMHTEKREALLNQIDKDSRLHAFLAGSITNNMADARELQSVLFSPTGVYGALTGMLGLGMGAMFIKRPGDLPPDQVEDV